MLLFFCFQKVTCALTQATGKRTICKSTSFHCYLLRSLDPSHPRKTYVGFTTDPHRRLRQHNGDLKAGGAKRTQRSGRPWEFVAIINDFTDQRTALQFEWAWQHGDKSKAVRNAIGDQEAKAVGRKHGVAGKLTMLKTLVSECEGFGLNTQTIFFFENSWMKEFDEIDTLSGRGLPSGINLKLVEGVQEMPFWSDRGTMKIKAEDIQGNHDHDEKNNSSNGHVDAWMQETTPSIHSSRRTTLLSLVTFVMTTPSLMPQLANAEIGVPQLQCDEKCMAERKRIIEERRAMMRQSMTTTRRQDIFDLSRQRAGLYNTTYQGAACLSDFSCL